MFRLIFGLGAIGIVGGMVAAFVIMALSVTTATVNAAVLLVAFVPVIGATGWACGRVLGEASKIAAAKHGGMIAPPHTYVDNRQITLVGPNGTPRIVERRNGETIAAHQERAQIEAANRGWEIEG